MAPRKWGTVRQNKKSKKWYARYRTANGKQKSAGMSFPTEKAAWHWLDLKKIEMLQGFHADPATVTFGEYVGILAVRNQERHTPRTKDHYGTMLDEFILPTFGHRQLARITEQQVNEWYREELNADTPTYRAHIYGLLHSIFNEATKDPGVLLQNNPCKIKGAGQVKKPRGKKVGRALTVAELDAIVEATPERWRAMVLLTAWCALRFSEVTELRRRDFRFVVEDGVEFGMVDVDRAVTRTTGQVHYGDPKWGSNGVVLLPPHLLDPVKTHLDGPVVGKGDDDLLFPGVRFGRNLPYSSMHKWWSKAIRDAGVGQLRFHDLRHTGSTLASNAGASLAEVMDRTRQSSISAAMVYQHAMETRKRQVAEGLSQLAPQFVPPAPEGAPLAPTGTDNVVPLSEWIARSKRGSRR
jgi:integrase